VTPQDGSGGQGFDAVVVGAGLGGLFALYRLREMGLSVLVVEAGPDVGGTWLWNRYPGARCDVESVDYSYSFSEELEQEWVWTERYASQPEILSYIRHVADRFDLRRHIRFDTRALSARFDEAAGRWNVGLDDDSSTSVRFLVLATGALSTANIPDIPGLADFRGETYHSGIWPQDHDPVFGGKHVALIGTGSSGIQLAPQLASVAERLLVLQRSPNYSIPSRNGPLTAEQLAEVRSWYPERRKLARRTKRGFPLPADLTTESVFSFTPEERLDRFERMWRHGGAIFTSTFGDLGVDKAANATAADFVRGKIREKVTSPAVADLLVPTDHPLGAKRPCVDTDYFETFNRDNVELVDIRAAPIEGITEKGIQIADRHLDVDAIVFATGFDAITGTLFKIDIRGRGGRTLPEHWASGPRSYLGIGVAGFPNMFVITGPGSPSVLCNMTVSIEQHVEWIRDLLVHMREQGIVTVEPDEAAETAWVDHVAELAAATLMLEGNSWYVGANIPGKPRVFMAYAAGMASYDAEVQAIAQDGYRGFVLRT